MTASPIYRKHKRHLREFTIAAQMALLKTSSSGRTRGRRKTLTADVASTRGPGRAMSPAKHLLSNVNFLFFIYVTQEQQQRAGAKNNCQHQRNHTLPLEDAVWARERPKLPNRSQQRGQAYN